MVPQNNQIYPVHSQTTFCLKTHEKRNSETDLCYQKESKISKTNTGIISIFLDCSERLRVILIH